MDNVFNLGKKAFAVAVAAATILWSVGLATLAVPTASAAASMGDLVKGESLSTVYFYGYDGMRYTFPNEKIYFSWFEDFSDVEEISDSDLADIDLAGNVMVRPGTYWIKVTSSAETYVVSTSGAILHVASEDVATDYAGSDWNEGIIDMPDAFFVDYTTGAPLSEATAFDGALYMDGGDYYISWDGEKRLVSEDGMDANSLQSMFFLDGSGIDDSDLSEGDSISEEVSALTDASQMGGEEEEEGSSATLEVSVASSTPAEASVPNSASGVEVATFKLEADEATSVDSLMISLDGLVDEDAFASSGVYLYEGDARLVDGRSVNSSTRSVTFAGLDLDFSAGESRYISVVVDMDTTVTSGEFAWEIASAEDVGTDATVDGDFPVTGEEMSIEDIDVGSITIVDTGSISDPTLGEEGAEIAQFRLTAGTAEDVEVESITLKVDDAADHSDYVLWNGSDEVASGEYIGDKLVLFSFDEALLIEEGDNEDFTVSATIGGEVADDIDVYLDNSADLRAIGSDYGFGVTVTRTGYDGEAGDLSSSTIQGGELTVAFNGPSASDVKDGAEDVSLFEFSMTAERWMEVQGADFSITGTDLSDTDPALTDIKLVNAETEALVAGPEELPNTTDTQTVSFSDSFVLEAGETLELMLTADIDEDVAASGDTYTVTLTTSTLDVEDEEGDAVTDIVPSADLAGYAQTVRSSALTVSLASTPTSDTYVKGSSDVSVAGYNLAAATGSDLTVTDLTVTVLVSEDADGSYTAGSDGVGPTSADDRITSCSLVDSDDEVVGGPESVESDGTIVFEGMSLAVDAGETTRVTLECDLANVDPGTSDLFAFEINPTSGTSTDYVTAEDDEGDSLSSSEITAAAVNASETVVLTIASAGSLAISAAADAPLADFIMTGSEDNSVSKFRFDATNEAFEVDRLTITEEQAETMTGTVNSDAYANNIESVTISYEDEDGVTQTADGSLTDNAITFNELSFYVPKDDHAEVTVMVDVAATDRSSGSATSNERIRMGVSVNTTDDDEFRAYGASSGTALDDDNLSLGSANTSQPTFVVRETKPTVSLSSSSPSGSDKVPGDQEVFRFNVAANSGEDLVLNQILFRIGSSDNNSTPTLWNTCDGTTYLSASDFDLYNLSTNGTTTAVDAASDWTLLDATGGSCSTEVVGYARLALTVPGVIPAGSTYSFALYIDTTGASSADDDSIQVSIDSDTTADFLSESALNESNVTATDTTLTVSDGTNYVVGDVLCMDTADDGCGAADERMLLVAKSTNDLTVVRGYLASAPDTTSANDAADDVDRIPGTFLWEDDGNSSDTSEVQELWGSYLVDNLSVTGNAIGF